MNRKRGQLGGLNEVIIFSVLAIVIIVSISVFISSGKNGAVFYEKAYSQELAFLIDSAENGSEVYFDVTPATAIAVKNGVPLENIFNFDNEKHEISIKLRKNGATSYNYVSDKIVADAEVKTISGGIESNRLYFLIK